MGLLIAGLAKAAIASSAPVLTEPEWIRKPTGEDFASYYPKKAMDEGKSGRALLVCKVDAAGGLVDCRTEDEIPADEGFGEAAMKMAHIFRMKPMTLDGQPVNGGTVKIPIRFLIPGGVYDPLSGATACYGIMADRAEADPNDADKWYAARFWALQVMSAATISHLKPSHVEEDLKNARLVAAHDPDAARARELAGSCTRVMQTAIKKK